MEYHSNPIKSADLITNEPALSEEAIAKLFIEFIREFKTTHKSYYAQLNANLSQNILSLTVQLEHIGQFNGDLFGRLTGDPDGTLRIFQEGLKAHLGTGTFQVLLSSGSAAMPLRGLSALRANRIVKIRGIVVSASAVLTKPRELCITCRSCQQSKMVREVIPRTCDTSSMCPLDPYVVVPERSIVSDVQYVKIQERFEDIPAGETPRHFTVLMEGILVNRVSPGSEITLVGVYSVRSVEDRGYSFMRGLFVEDGKNKVRQTFTEEEEAAFKELARSSVWAGMSHSNVSPVSPYELIARSIAPGIFGHEDIKRTLACMLFGGTRRVRADGISLRGDINVLLLGDPGVAKSQMLKFMQTVSPIGVYTSGRGSSAAGLTASIIKDKGGEFYLEGGALVLADGGICCIDEFDKMNENDRVAIHEAMEQQTISIAKAGITTVLNARAAVLAAANPVFGRYDDLKTAAENIEFGTTILSRFDCIFVIKDKSGAQDRQMAEHVLDLHRGATAPGDALPAEALRAYAQYAKAKVSPSLSQAAAARLSKFYVDIRRGARRPAAGSPAVIPITVRQLEAIIRLSESLARMELSQTVTTAHVDEAIRLFQASTMNAAAQGHVIEGMERPDFLAEINAIAGRIEHAMPVGTAVRFNELFRSVGGGEALFRRAVDFMVKQNRLVSKDFGRTLVRRPQ